MLELVLDRMLRHYEIEKKVAEYRIRTWDLRIPKRNLCQSIFGGTWKRKAEVYIYD